MLNDAEIMMLSSMFATDLIKHAEDPDTLRQILSNIALTLKKSM